MRKNKRTKKELIEKVLDMRRRVAKLEMRLEQKASSSEENERYRLLVESTNDSIYLVDRECRYLFMNKEHLLRLGLTKKAFVGKYYGDFHSIQDTNEFTEKINKVIKSGKSLQYICENKKTRCFFLRTLSPVKGDKRKTVAVTIISKDITKLKEAEEKLRILSLTDDLTGLYNRRGFFALAEHQLRVAERQKRKIVLIYIDLDNLKKINDKFGHNAGSHALIKTSKILKTHFRKSDIIARLGGDEFVIIPVGGSSDVYQNIGERLNKHLKLFNSKNKLGYRLSISMGVAVYDPYSPCTIYELISKADKLMYSQKKIKAKK